MDLKQEVKTMMICDMCGADLENVKHKCELKSNLYLNHRFYKLDLCFDCCLKLKDFVDNERSKNNEDGS